MRAQACWSAPERAGGISADLTDERRAGERALAVELREPVKGGLVGFGGPADVVIASAGDSVGGNMTAALTLLAKERSGPELAADVLFYPVTDAGFDTGSYHEFSTGYFLRRDVMQWFWDQNTTDEAERDERTASPLRAGFDQRRAAAGARHHRRGRHHPGRELTGPRAPHQRLNHPPGHGHGGRDFESRGVWSRTAPGLIVK